MLIDKIMENLFSKGFLSADELMKVSWKMFQERFLKILYIFLLSTVTFVCIATVLMALALFSQSVEVIFFAFFLAFVALLFVVLVQNIMFFEVIRNKNIRIRQAFKRSLPKMKPYIGSLALYLLISLNLIFFFVFLSCFISMSVIFANILPAAQGVSVIFGIMTTFLAFFMGIGLLIPFFFAYVWQYFLFFDLIIADMPVRESLDHSFSLIRRHGQYVFERAIIFASCYLLILLTLVILSSLSPVFGAIAEVAHYVLCIWATMYLYAMYENLKAVSPDNPSSSDRQVVSFMLKSGAVILVTAVLLLIFSCMFLLAQMNFSSAMLEAQTALQYPLNNL